MDLILGICSFIGLSCIPLPNVSAIQIAYEHEASSGNSLHDKGLTVLSTKCHRSGSDQALCEVTFISRDDPTERLYFDIVAVARTSEGWQLKSGLCKR